MLPNRDIVSDRQRRKAYLKHAYETGFFDGLNDRQDLALYDGDQEAKNEYLHGRRIGRRERERGDAA